MMATYIIHNGVRNKKVRGEFSETFNSQTGQRFLVGKELIKTLHWKDANGRRKVEEVYADVRIDITNLTYTKRG